MNGYQYLTNDCLIQIFSFLQDAALINTSSVCKQWHEAADTPWLWREMCLQRWDFCNISVVGAGRGKQQWKAYYLRRSHLEMKMTKGRSRGDYCCKSLRGHSGRVVGLDYLRGNSPQLFDFYSCTPTVCSASSDGTVRAWDVQKGEQLWCSPLQSPMTSLVVDVCHGVIFTADSTGVIKAWQGQTGQEMASYSSESPHCTLLQYSIDNNSYVSVGTSQGAVHTLSSPSLSKLSSLVVCDTFKVNLLQVSPDKKWMLAGTKENNDLSPKVISSQSLVMPTEEEEPQCQCLAVPGCCAVAFIPSQPARLATIHHRDSLHNRTLSMFDISMKKNKYKSEIQVQQVASFDVGINSTTSDVLLEAKGSTLVVVADKVLRVYSLTGALLASFSDHTEPITSICVDSFHVVTASWDLSLRVLTWRRDCNKGLTLDSRYHLLGGSHSMSRGFTRVVCDYSSIIASTEAVDGRDVLKAYAFSN
ncbi:F-box/WD repeat-containing protein 12 [Hypomesus transpacificus]|uniref:F-box/WD repeat-containing protein 12 n=1 Tax=Hypomesus transpacificus TaxID=137520 RepID=UPI001F0838DC|nr:F-box/WD repeat-containing protein 12 [Hypomesus transpacificus]